MSPSDLRHALSELARDADTHNPGDRLARVHRQARQTARTRAVAGATAAVVVVLGGTWAVRAAWSPEAVGPSTPGASTVPTTPPPTRAVSPTPSPSPVVSHGPALVDSTCAPTALTVRLGQPDGAAGSTFVPVVLTNTGSDCRLQGFPVVALTTTDRGAAVGAVSTPEPGFRQTVVKLPRGGQASALVRIADASVFAPSDCAAAPVAYLRFTPPGRHAATTYLALPGQRLACSKPVQLLFVRPVVEGPTGQS